MESQKPTETGFYRLPMVTGQCGVCKAIQYPRKKALSISPLNPLTNSPKGLSKTQLKGFQIDQFWAIIRSRSTLISEYLKPHPMTNKPSTPVTLLMFLESGKEYAISTAKIYEVLNHRIVYLPSPIPGCSGNIYFNGVLIPVFPVTETYKPYEESGLQAKSIIVFRQFFENRHHWLAFKADEIKGVCTVESDKIFTSEEWPMIQIPAYTQGLFFNKNRPVFLLDPTLLLQQKTMEDKVLEHQNQSITI
jgi:chemotaxis signal transduction protein